MEIPSQIRSERLKNSVYIRFSADFTHRIGTPHARNEIARWRAQVPELHDLTDLSDLPALVAADPDRIFGGLLQMYQAGSALAGAALLHQMCPKLIRLTSYARVRRDCGSSAYAERSADTIAAFLHAATTYHGTGRNIAAALALKTLGTITTADTSTEIPASDLLDEREDHDTAQPTDITADEVLDWAVARAVITTADRTLLERAYLTDGTDLRALALEMNLTYPALRQRLHRTISRLSAAVATTTPVGHTGKRRTHIHRRAA